MNNNINTLFIGKVLLSFSELDSTNTYALSLLSKNKPSEGTVISTPNQTKGRGQIGNSWESAAGKNISISIILYPSFLAVNQQFKLNQAIALGIADFLAPYIDTGLKVKWPNDIFVNDKKIAGVLIQNSLSGPKIQSCVVGIGVNVNQKSFFSDAPNPTSMSLETSREGNVESLIPKLCESIEKRYLQLRARDFQKLEKDYLECLYRLQEEALYQITDSGDIISGKIVGLTDTGRLVLDTLKGECIFAFKEIKFL